MNQDARVTALPEKLVADYLEVRKAKRAGPFTETAVDQMAREGLKVGISLEEAMRYCVGAGWQGFNAGWYAKREQVAGPVNRQQALEDRNQKIAAEWARGNHATQ